MEATPTSVITSHSSTPEETKNIFDDFNKALRSFFLTHAELEIDIKYPTVKQHIYGHIRFYSSKDLENLVVKLLENLPSVDRSLFSADYFTIWLKKELWISTVIKRISASGCAYGRNEEYKDTSILLNVDECQDDSVTSLRIDLLKTAIQNLAEFNGCIIEPLGINILVSNKNKSDKSNLILCSKVICDLTAEKYKERKKDAITKMSANRFSSDEYPADIVSKLCNASIIYELLSVRHNKVVNSECDSSNKDIGIFIMYNYSRLRQVWAAFEKGVSEKKYEPLPDLSTIDFKLLSTDEEWILIFNYLSVCPSVIQETVKYLLLSNIYVHKLCKFLMDMASAVSLFYHKHHVLSDPIPSLLPVMYARLYLIKTSIQVFENIFKLLGIDAACEM